MVRAKPTALGVPAVLPVCKDLAYRGFAIANDPNRFRHRQRDCSAIMSELASYFDRAASSAA